MCDLQHNDLGSRGYPLDPVFSFWGRILFYILHIDCHGEGLRLAKDRLDEKNVYYMNPSFDK